MAVTESASQNTPLHLCAMNGYAKVAGVILEGKASVDPVNKISKTPLLYACMEVKIKSICTYTRIIFCLFSKKIEASSKKTESIFAENSMF